MSGSSITRVSCFIRSAIQQSTQIRTFSVTVSQFTYNDTITSSDFNNNIGDQKLQNSHHAIRQIHTSQQLHQQPALVKANIPQPNIILQTLTQIQPIPKPKPETGIKIKFPEEQKCIKENGTFVNAVGQKLYCHYWKPTGVTKPRALVMVMHGLGEHVGYYDPLAQLLAKEKCLTFGNDFFGHGRSEGSPVHLKDYDHYVRDSMQHINILKKQYPDSPIYVVAHSMGAMVPVKTEISFPGTFSGMVLMSPLIRIHPKRRHMWRYVVTYALHAFMPELQVSKINLNVVARDKEIQKQVIEDPYFWKGGVKLSWILTTNRAQVRLPKFFPQVKSPMLIQHGEYEKIADVESSKKLIETSSSTDKHMQVYKNGGHQLYNDVLEIRQKAMRDAVQWICERT